MSLITRSVEKLGPAVIERLAPYPSLQKRAKRVLDGYYRMRGKMRYVRLIRRRIQRIEEQVRNSKVPALNQSEGPILFYNTSAKTGNISFMSLTWQIIQWSLRLEGHRVINMSCQGGLTHCVCGTAYPQVSPPCRECRLSSQLLYSQAEDIAFTMDRAAFDALPVREDMTFEELVAFEHDGFPLGRICRTSLRWALRCHHVEKQPGAREMLTHYIRSGLHLYQAFEKTLDRVRPSHVVIFNGTFYPEAIARHISLQRGFDTITFEIGHSKGSVFLTRGISTETPLPIPDDYVLNEEENHRVDAYLEKRFKGDFFMGGIKFWKKIESIPPTLQQKIERYPQMVSAYTNVVFDTTQATSHTAFESLFHWLDAVVDIARKNPKTLFIIRAHPDEQRASKASRETIEERLQQNGGLGLENMEFVAPQNKTSSYDLIRLSKFVLVYNSTVGLECPLMGKACLSAARSKYGSHGVTYVANTAAEFEAKVTELLHAAQALPPANAVERARRYLYFLIFRSSLDISRYLYYPAYSPGWALQDFQADDLRPSRHREMQIIHDGILRGGNFLN